MRTEISALYCTFLRRFYFWTRFIIESIYSSSLTVWFSADLLCLKTVSTAEILIVQHKIKITHMRNSPQVNGSSSFKSTPHNTPWTDVPQSWSILLTRHLLEISRTHRIVLYADFVFVLCLFNAIALPMKQYLIARTKIQHQATKSALESLSTSQICTLKHIYCVLVFSFKNRIYCNLLKQTLEQT